MFDTMAQTTSGLQSWLFCWYTKGIAKTQRPCLLYHLFSSSLTTTPYSRKLQSVLTTIYCISVFNYISFYIHLNITSKVSNFYPIQVERH